MEDFTIELKNREVQSKGSLGRLRKSGMLPGVVYERGGIPIPMVVVEKDFRHLAQKAKSSQLFRLKSEDSRVNGRRALVREVQRDFRNNTLLHVDFHALSEDQEIHISVPVTLVGEAVGVKTEGGILSFSTHTVALTCLLRDIPDKLEVEITALHLGQSIHAGDIVLPEGVRLSHDPKETIVTVLAVRTADEVVPAAIGTAS